MLFNSGIFGLFFAAFLGLYWLVRGSVAWRNRLIVAASWFFYGWWDWRFLPLLVASSVLDWWLGMAVEDATGVRRKRLVGLSVAVNIGLLGVFKYFGFFADSLAALIRSLGGTPDWPTLHVVLPVGISFYTFQSLGYVLDVYRGKVKAGRDLTQFLAYVAFFPQLVAGPIERASHLLPQFATTRRITDRHVREGCWLVLLGLFRKVVVADNCGTVADMAFDQQGYTAAGVVVGTIAFALQIYCDFAGYSDMARGLARLLGFELMENFWLPYFATGLRDFWRRWHISLSQWLRDNLYIPLGGNRHGSGRTAIALFLTLLIGGLWHGAAWHFVAWGAWHGLGLAATRGMTGMAARLPKVLSWAMTMAFVGAGWVLFRVPDLRTAWEMSLAAGVLELPGWFSGAMINLLWFGLPLLVLDLVHRRTGAEEWGARLGPWSSIFVQGTMLFLITRYWHVEGTAFIYFQF